MPRIDKHLSILKAGEMRGTSGVTMDARRPADPMRGFGRRGNREPGLPRCAAARHHFGGVRRFRYVASTASSSSSAGASSTGCAPARQRPRHDDESLPRQTVTDRGIVAQEIDRAGDAEEVQNLRRLGRALSALRPGRSR